jgi:hypothetical protein
MSYDFYTTNNYSDVTTVGGLIMPSVFTQADDIVKVEASGTLVLYTPTYVNGPAVSVVNQVPVFSDTTGKNIITSLATVDDTGKLTAAGLVVGVLSYPAVDSVAGSILTSDGAGNLTLALPSANSQSMVYGMLNASQATPVVGDHVSFAVELFSKGTLVTLDSTTAYTSAPNVDSMGRYTLASGFSYILEAQVTNLVLNKHTGSVTFQWYNSDTSAVLGQPITVNGSGGATGAIKYGFGNIKAFITTTASSRVELRVMSVADVVSFETSYSNVIQFL